MDKYLYEECKYNKEVRDLKIKNLIYAINQSKKMISESKSEEQTLTFLRRQLSKSIQDLELLYLLRGEEEKNCYE